VSFFGLNKFFDIKISGDLRIGFACGLNASIAFALSTFRMCRFLSRHLNNHGFPPISKKTPIRERAATENFILLRSAIDDRGVVGTEFTTAITNQALRDSFWKFRSQ